MYINGVPPFEAGLLEDWIDPYQGARKEPGISKAPL